MVHGVYRGYIGYILDGGEDNENYCRGFRVEGPPIFLFPTIREFRVQGVHLIHVPFKPYELSYQAELGTTV